MQTIAKQLITVKKVVDKSPDLEYTLQIARFIDPEWGDIRRADRVILKEGIRSRSLVARCVNHYAEGIMKVAAVHLEDRIDIMPSVVDQAKQIEGIIEEVVQGDLNDIGERGEEMSPDNLFFLGLAVTSFLQDSRDSPWLGWDALIGVIFTYEGEEPMKWGHAPTGDFGKWGSYWIGISRKQWKKMRALFPSMKPQEALESLR
jgi:hypothetical protein